MRAPNMFFNTPHCKPHGSTVSQQSQELKDFNAKVATRQVRRFKERKAK